LGALAGLVIAGVPIEIVRWTGYDKLVADPMLAVTEKSYGVGLAADSGGVPVIRPVLASSVSQLGKPDAV
jgi:hypothetical protein